MTSLGEIMAGLRPKTPPKNGQQPPDTSMNLNRTGLAVHEEAQGGAGMTPWQIFHDRASGERLLRVVNQAEFLLKDIRKGLRDKSNSVTVKTFDTNAAPATNQGAGVFLTAEKNNGGVPWNGFTIKSVGGAGTTMDVSINDCDWIPSVASGDIEENLEIWKIAFRVRTGGAGTATIILYSYIPGIGGLKGVS